MRRIEFQFQETGRAEPIGRRPFRFDSAAIRPFGFVGLFQLRIQVADFFVMFELFVNDDGFGQQSAPLEAVGGLVGRFNRSR